MAITATMTTTATIATTATMATTATTAPPPPTITTTTTTKTARVTTSATTKPTFSPPTSEWRQTCQCFCWSHLLPTQSIKNSFNDATRVQLEWVSVKHLKYFLLSLTVLSLLPIGSCFLGTGRIYVWQNRPFLGSGPDPEGPGVQTTCPKIICEDLGWPLKFGHVLTSGSIVISICSDHTRN